MRGGCIVGRPESGAAFGAKIVNKDGSFAVWLLFSDCSLEALLWPLTLWFQRQPLTWKELNSFSFKLTWHLTATNQRFSVEEPTHRARKQCDTPGVGPGARSAFCHTFTNLCIVNLSLTVRLAMSSVLHSEASKGKYIQKTVHVQSCAGTRDTERFFLATPAHSLTTCPTQISGSVAHWRRSSVHHRGKNVRGQNGISTEWSKKESLLLY